MTDKEKAALYEEMVTSGINKELAYNLVYGKVIEDKIEIKKESK